MQSRFWGLSSSPFTDGSGTHFDAGSVLAAEAKLSHLVQRDLGVGVLVGDSGLGKSWLIHRLVEQNRRAHGMVADVFFPQMEIDELLGFLADELDVNRPSRPLKRDERVGAIKRKLQKTSAAGGRTLIVIDDAHLANAIPLLETLQLLLNLRQPQRVGLNVVLAGAPALLRNLQLMPSFASRVAIVSELLPYTAKETAAFIQNQLNSAGGPQNLFTGEAIDSVARLAAGVPRAINRLCDMALFVADAEQADRVTATHVQAVAPETLRIAA